MGPITGIDKKVAECVGLWLAEGDKKTNREITFTNNCFELVLFFHRTLKKVLEIDESSVRVYIYTKNKKSIKLQLGKTQIKQYIDERANKPYFIWRLASVNLLAKWKRIVTKIIEDEKEYANILRGFFAGEGNLKTGSHHNRAVRISQKVPLELIDRILAHYNIISNFSQSERAYVITSRENWDKLAQLNIAELHPDKGQKFWEIYKSFKEYHYSHNYIKERIIEMLKNPKTSRELANEFSRSQARIQDILIPMKKEGKINLFRVGSISYWISDKTKVILSKRKYKILLFLTSPKLTSQIAKYLRINWKAAYRRLEELKKLNLVKRDNYLWYKIQSDKEVLVL